MRLEKCQNSVQNAYNRSSIYFQIFLDQKQNILEKEEASFLLIIHPKLLLYFLFETFKSLSLCFRINGQEQQQKETHVN